jgi:hypothetical protein
MMIRNWRRTHQAPQVPRGYRFYGMYIFYFVFRFLIHDDLLGFSL